LAVDRNNRLAGGFFEQSEANFGLVGTPRGTNLKSDLGVKLSQHQCRHFINQAI